MTLENGVLGTNIPPGPVKITKAKQVVAGGPQDTVGIVLEDSEHIPPTGLFVGLNGRGYLIRPGERVVVPKGVAEILDNAIYSAPVIDPMSRRVVGHRDRMRYPYRVVAEAA